MTSIFNFTILSSTHTHTRKNPPQPHERRSLCQMLSDSRHEICKIQFTQTFGRTRIGSPWTLAIAKQHKLHIYTIRGSSFSLQLRRYLDSRLLWMWVKNECENSTCCGGARDPTARWMGPWFTGWRSMVRRRNWDARVCVCLYVCVCLWRAAALKFPSGHARCLKTSPEKRRWVSYVGDLE